MKHDEHARDSSKKDNKSLRDRLDIHIENMLREIQNESELKDPNEVTSDLQDMRTPSPVRNNIEI